MAKASGQKFIGRNRAPRVQIEYDVEVYGAEKVIQLPFVMGVMSDLSGKPEEAPPPVADRKFLEIDVDNFDDRLKSMKPRAAFPVPNTLTGEGNLMVDITFESMDDFSPAAVARKVEPLRQLLETRTQLANLLTWMDGKSGAEELIGKLLQDQPLLQTLASTPAPATPEPPAAEAAPPAAPAETPQASGEESDDLDSLLGGLADDDGDKTS
jgi:type VI secretion system protein ImpB